MLYALAGMVIGVAAALFLPISLPAVVSGYMVAAIIVCIDAVLGGIVSRWDGKFSLRGFFISFACNLVFALGFLYLGMVLNLDLSVAVIVVFMLKLFRNFAAIYHSMIARYKRD